MSITPAAVLPGVCPQCQSRLAAESDHTPWCERCEWNLDAYTPDPLVGRLTRLQERWAHRIGYRLDRELFAKLSARPLSRPGGGIVGAALTAISALVAVLLLGLLAGGVLLIVEGHFLWKALGLIMVGFAVLCRPRLGRVKDVCDTYDELTRERQPRLFGLLDRIADAAGAPRPQVVALSAEWNASASVLGLARRRVLVLGLPLWAGLRPQERVALLGHELGHFINNDNRRSLRTQPALVFFGQLASVLDPRSVFGRDDAENTLGIGLMMKLAELLVTPVLWLLSRLCWLPHLGLNVLGAQDGQRAEYYADDLGSRLAGSTAMLTTLDVMACSEVHTAVIGSRARGKAGAAQWREAVEQARDGLTPRLARLRQLTRRDTSPFASHPPTALRHRMVAAQPHRDAQVVLTDTEAALIDAELAGFEERYRRVLAQDW